MSMSYTLLNKKFSEERVSGWNTKKVVGLVFLPYRSDYEKYWAQPRSTGSFFYKKKLEF